MWQGDIAEFEIMEEFLKQWTGRKIDVTCAANTGFRGEVIDVKSGILSLRDEYEKIAHIAIDKITAVCELADSQSRPGFIA